MKTTAGDTDRLTATQFMSDHWLAAANRTLYLQAEAAVFAAKRISRHRDTVRLLAECRGPDERMSTMVAFNRDTLSDYADWIAHIGAVGVAPTAEAEPESDFARVRDIANTMADTKTAPKQRRRYRGAKDLPKSG